IFRVKLHKKLSSGRYLPLLVHKSDKEDWDILKEITAVVDYVNREKQIIHAITTDFEEVFFPQIEEGLAKGDFISAKVLSKTVNGETRLELKRIIPIDPSEGRSKYPTEIAIVDDVNNEKKLFHFVISKGTEGIVRFNETEL